jgi:hypothetical protein
MRLKDKRLGNGKTDFQNRSSKRIIQFDRDYRPIRFVVICRAVRKVLPSGQRELYRFVKPML